MPAGAGIIGYISGLFDRGLGVWISAGKDMPSDGW